MSENSNSSLPISIVIAARNEAANLPRLINQLVAQKYHNYEIIIVNDRSTDNSIEVLSELGSKTERIVVIEIAELPDGWNGKKHALVKGIEASKNPYILVTDADCIPDSSNWISTMTGRFSDDIDFILGFSRYEESPGFLNHFIRYETLWTAIQYLSMALAGRPYMGVGRNLAYRKSTFLNFGFLGVENVMGGDDDLFVNQYANSKNTRIQIHPDSITTSMPKTSWSDYFKQKIRHLSAGKHYRKKDRTRLGVFALCNLSGWILLFYLLLSGFNPLWILTIFGFRSIVFYSIFTRIGQKLGVRIAPLTLPLLDLFFNLFHLVAGFRALTAKRIKWS